MKNQNLNDTIEPKLEMVSLDKITPSGTNPRKSFPADSLLELAESIKTYGVKQPILIRPLARYELLAPDLTEKRWHIVTSEPGGLRGHEYVDTVDKAKARFAKLTKGRDGKEFEIVCGERRYRASILANRKTIPCVIETLGDKEARLIQGIENLQREDLNPIEEAEGYKRLMEEDKLTVKDLQEKLGKSRSHIFAKLALLKVSPAVRKAMEGGQLEASIGALIGRVPGKALQEQALERIAFSKHDDPMSYRTAKEWLETHFTVDLKAAKFDRKRAYAGTPHDCACEACPRRSGNARDEFPDIKSPDVCTDPLCFKLRGEIHGKDVAAALAGKGARVLSAKETKDLFDADGEFRGYRGEYERLDETTWQCGNERNSYKKLLGEHAPNIVAIAPNGEAIRVFSKKDLSALLEKAGVKQERSSGGGRSAAEKKLDAEVKMRKEVAKAIVPDLLNKLMTGHEAASLKLAVWRMLADSAYDHTSIDDHAFVAKRRGLCKVQNDARASLEKFIKASQNDALALALLTLELLIAGQPVNRWEGKFNQRFTEACEAAKIDIEGREEAAKVDTKGTKDGKKGGGK